MKHRVLLVEDEPLLHRVITRELGDGFDVIAVTTAHAAAQHLDEREDLAAVISDLDLGATTSGITVLDNARRRRPAAIRILISARATPEEIEREICSGLVAKFLQKPWPIGSLRRELQRRIATAVRRWSNYRIDPVDADLLERASAGDQESEEALFTRYRALVAKIIYVEHRICPSDAEDVYQEARIRFSHYLARVEHPSSFIATAARTACLGYHRSHRRRRAAHQAFAVLNAPRSGNFRRIEDALAHRLDVRKVIKEVGEECRQLLTDLLLKGATHREYADANGTFRGTVGPAAAKCVRKLRAVLTGGGYQSGATR